MATLNIPYYDTYSLSIELDEIEVPKTECKYKLTITQNDTTERKSAVTKSVYFLSNDQLREISNFIMENVNDKQLTN
jgi:hypothetical protein